MATKKSGTSKRPRRTTIKVVKTDETVPTYGFTKLYYIDWRSRTIVQGEVERINTIHKKQVNGENETIGVLQDHYYTLKVSFQTETVTKHQGELFPTQLKAGMELSKNLTEYLR